MVKKMLAAALAIGLMANGASAQVSSEEAKARKEAEAARAQAEKMAGEAKRLAAELKAMQRRMEALEKQVNASRNDAETQRARAENQRELAVKAARDAQRKATDGNQERAAKAVKEAEARMKEALAKRQAVVGSGKKEAFIGVVTDQTPEALATHLGVKGLIVTQVLDDSPAKKAGLKANDILLSMNGTALTSPDQFKKLVVGETGGSKAVFVVLRGGKKQEIAAVLGERDANRMGMFFDGKNAPFKVDGKDGVMQFKFDGGAFGKDNLFEKELPGGARAFGRARVGGKAGEGAGSNSTSLSISANDGNITIAASVTKDGKTQTVKESGTRDELLKKIDKFPEGIRDSIRQSLEGIETGSGGKGNRIRIERKVNADAKEGGEEGRKVRVRTLDPKAKAELELLNTDKFKAFADMKAFEFKDGALKELEGAKLEHLKALEGLSGKLEKLEGLKELEGLKKLEGLKDLEGLQLKLEKLGDLKDLEGLQLKLEKLGDLKDLEALKDLDVKVHVLGAEGLKDLKDKLPKEIELEIKNSLKELGAKDKLKDKLKEKVLIERRDSQ